MENGEAIWQELQGLVNKKAEDYRAKSDSNVHCMDVGISALKASDSSIDYSIKEKLHRLFRAEFFTTTSLEEAILHSRDTSNIDRCLFVEDPKWGDYIVGPSYDRLRARTSKALKFSKVKSNFTGTDVSGKTTTNIGHLSLKTSISATTPLETKLSKILDALQGVPIASSLVSRKLLELHKYHKIDTAYQYNRKSFDLQAFQSILGSGTILVTLQTAVKNKALATLETKIELEVRNYLSSAKFHNRLLRAKGSNSILEDIEKGLIAALLGRKTVPGSKHLTKPTKTANTKLLTPRKVAVTRPAAIRNVSGQFYSLASLQALLDRHLQDVISANMGNGSDKRVLNYRTGRLAASAKVERLSASREGMITAFYSYMRNPYGTFSEGGRQQYPRSRDPKLLIGNSIKEIAATQVANRMRAVLV